MGRRPQKLELTWFNKDKALIPTEEGKYGYTWVDPKDPRYCETHTLIVDDIVRDTQAPKEDGTTYSERADLEPTEDNLLILGESGDVLEALTRVPELADKYVGQVKCVYIDPPFNTAQTFANYEDNLEHSIWLTMMRDRLIHLRELLSDDGSIWVHLDDVESHRMRLLLDEVFGAENFVGDVIWKNGVHVRNDAKNFSSNHDTILVYSKGTFSLNKLPPSEEMIARFTSPDGDPNGWQSIASGAPGAATHQGMVFAIQHPLTGELMYPARGNCWRYSQDRMFEYLNRWVPYRLADLNDAEKRAEICGVPAEEVRAEVHGMLLDLPQEKSAQLFQERYAAGDWPPIFFTGKGGSGGLRVKGYMPDDYTRVPLTIWEDAGRNDTAKREIKTLFPGVTPFSTPKPEFLLEKVIHIATEPGDIVLDIFAGSGTTAAVAHKMGRRWVTCELVEDTMERFTRPRLEKVVLGKDPGGITLTHEERVDATEDGLPEGISAEDAQKLTSLLNKVITDRDDLKKNPVVRELKSMVKTKKSKGTINWRGGGSFRVARLSSSCFDYDPEIDLVTLTETATGQTLVASVAANLGFYLTPEDRHFDGVLGRQHLAVVEGVLDDAKVDDLMAHLPDGHTLLIAATIVTDGVREHVRSFNNGSRVVHIPLDIFTYTAAQEEN